jgi:hypothetical protein
MSNDSEITALTTVHDVLKDLDQDARQRTLKWVAAKFGITTLSESPQNQKTASIGLPSTPTVNHDEKVTEVGASALDGKIESFNTVGELISAIYAETDWERVLGVAAYLQKKNSDIELNGYAINKELKQAGYGVGNITVAMSRSVNARPQLITQLRKDGKSKQAKKTFKVTYEGLKWVENRLAKSAQQD